MNFREDLERKAQDGTEYQFGAIVTDIAAIPLLERLNYVPDGVLQYNSLMDSNGCASRSPVNIYKAKFTYLYHNGMLPELKKWMEDNGYVKNGKVVFDETFIEILSGTTPTGNSLKAPLEAIRKYGLIPELLPLGEMTWEEYMNPSRITPAMYALGEEFKKRFKLGYEQANKSAFVNLWKVDWIDVAAHAWPAPIDGVYPRTNEGSNHAFGTINDEIYALDNYYPFLKKLAKDYNFFEWGYSLSVISQTVVNESDAKIPGQVFAVLLQNGLISYFVDWFKRFFK